MNGYQNRVDTSHGPTEWDDRDIWQGIDDALKRNDVRSAATLLRSYLEYTSAQVCHKLRAPVEFRGDARFELGDLLPSAISRFRTREPDGARGALVVIPRRWWLARRICLV
jgi:hypothetical protein